MRIHYRKHPRPPALIAGIALVMAVIAFSFDWIPASVGGEQAMVAPAAPPSHLAQDGALPAPPDDAGRPAASGKLAAVTPDGDPYPETGDLALFLDWHMDASGGYHSILDGLSCLPRTALAVPPPARGSGSLETGRTLAAGPP